MRLIVKSKLALVGPGLEPVERAALAVEDGRIAYVGSMEELTPAADDEVLELGESTLLPGLVDAHSHLGLDAFKDEDPQILRSDMDLAARGPRHARIDLRAGVTTMRLVGERAFMDVAWRELIEEGVVQGPRLRVSGPAFTASNGFGPRATRADGPDEIRRLVRRNLKEEVDGIKLFVSGGGGSKPAKSWTSHYSPAEIEAAVEEAHNVGAWVAAHIHGGPGVKYAAEAGVDTIEHAHYIDDSDCELMAAKGTRLVFTLGIIHYEGPGVEHHPQYEVHKNRIRALDGRNVRLAVKHGVKFASATDAMHGLLWFEAECLTNFGVKNKDAILAVTQSAAEACGMGDQVGTLEIGKQADLVALDGNPLDDIGALRNVRSVLKAGELVEISAL